ncbi:restriction endonuclease subunit S [Tetragenococcus halophilus]|uniref:restriction endonuclease subunit S n=1 Tax=Tetragenococcus halophilus TaxID=51669 RepID=UPI0030C9C3FC
MKAIPTWKQRKFGNLVNRVTKLNETANLPRIEFEDIVSGQGQLNKDIYQKKNNKKGIEFEPGDILFGKLRPYLKNWLYASFNGIAVGDFWVLRSNGTRSTFIYPLLQTSRYQYIANLSSGTKMPRSDWKTVSKTTFRVPTQIEEQSKIGTFLKQIDNTIILHQRKLDKLQELKKALLQPLFPKKDEVIPKVRFTNFNEPWKQCKLKDMLKERNEQIQESDNYPLMSFVQGVGVTPKNDRYNRNFLVKHNNKKYKKTELGDFIYSSNNLETGSIGINKEGKAVISPVYSIFSSKNNLESQFIGILSTRKDFINKMLRFRQGVVYGQWRIHEKDFLNINVTIPSYREQGKIVSLFENLDKSIVLYQTKLEKLHNLKKSLLQKMFI